MRSAAVTMSSGARGRSVKPRICQSAGCGENHDLADGRKESFDGGVEIVITAEIACQTIFVKNRRIRPGFKDTPKSIHDTNFCGHSDIRRANVISERHGRLVNGLGEHQEMQAIHSPFKKYGITRIFIHYATSQD